MSNLKWNSVNNSCKTNKKGTVSVMEFKQLAFLFLRYQEARFLKDSLYKIATPIWLYLRKASILFQVASIDFINQYNKSLVLVRITWSFYNMILIQNFKVDLEI